jgi:hypothetical protein
MFKSSAIFLILFLGMTSCLEVSLDSSVMLPGIESQSQLVNMMVQVQSEANPKTIGGFVKQLQEMLDKLVNAQAKHVKIHAKMMHQCTVENLYRIKECKTAKVSLAKALSARLRCRASLRNAQKELPALERSLQTYQNELKRAQVARNEEHRKYALRKAEFLEALHFIDDFVGYLHKKLAGYHSLLEMSENLVRHTTRVNLLASAVPVLVAIATDAESSRKAHSYKFTPNTALVNRLLTLIKELRAKIQHDHEQNEAIEQASAKIFAVYKRRLDAVIAVIQKNVNRVRKQIVDMTRCIDEESAIIVSSNNKYNRNHKLLVQAEKMCKNFNKEFIEATYNRLNEIKTMQEIMTIVAKRFKHLPKHLIEYLEEVKNGFKTYVNGTEFKKFKEYERVQYAKNKHGALLAKFGQKKHVVVKKVVKKKVAPAPYKSPIRNIIPRNKILK